MVSGMDELRERIARALWDRQQVMTSKKYPGFIVWRWDEIDDEQRAQFLEFADAVIAALGLTERRVSELDPGDCMPHRMFMTPWERIEEDA